MNVIRIDSGLAVDVANLAATKFIELYKLAIETRGRFTVALSGGSTPKAMYSLLACEPFSSQIAWDNIQFFFGDERFVPPDSPESNYRMVNESLFSKITIPHENIHRFQTELGDPTEAAEFLETQIKQVFSLADGEFPRFDLILLGLGEDGHTASLFPETTALTEKKRIAMENFVAKFDSFRLTFTFPTINNARNVMFLISGQSKRQIFNDVFGDTSQRKTYPANSVAPVNGKLFIIDSID